jgi:allophanate hydrolase
MSIPSALLIDRLTAGYGSGAFTPTALIREVYRRNAELDHQPLWIHLVPEKDALRRAAELEADAVARSLPLYGIPFAIKDNIDVAAMPTTAACPAYAYTPTTTAPVVARLLAAGAILIGKTNLDQFATGLVGVRSPYGACSSVFHKDYISGGSSAGSAVAVAAGLVSFSLGTDTAGSGRVPAAFNNLIGAKPTRGLLSTTGVVPACRSLDCVSIFALDSCDAATVLKVAEGFDACDPFSRAPMSAPAPWLNAGARIGIPPPDQREFFGDAEAARLFEAAALACDALGMKTVEIDFSPFRAAADLLYSGPWVAERLAALESFLHKHADAMNPTVRAIVEGAAKYSAVDGFRAQYELERLRKLAALEWTKMDVMLLPTTGTTYRKSEVESEPVRLNTNLGYYTNFVNLMDLSAIAVPAGFRSNGLPFGVSLIGPAFSDYALLELASWLHTSLVQPLGGTRDSTAQLGQFKSNRAGSVEVAVVGAHLTGQPLNHELTTRGARLLKTCQTAAGYRFYALRDTTPPKPGLVRDAGFTGPGIELEVWSMAETEFGSFVAGIPAPLGIGNVTLDDGSVVKGFICEPYAVEGSRDITTFGGWRTWLKAKATAV